MKLLFHSSKSNVACAVVSCVVISTILIVIVVTLVSKHRPRSVQSKETKAPTHNVTELGYVSTLVDVASRPASTSPGRTHSNTVLPLSPK